MGARRRDVLVGGMAVAMGLGGGEASAAGDRPIVVTGSGPVVGTRAGAVVAFKGIPFAKPPLGPLRFRPPEAVTPWREPRDAAAFGASPIQPRIPMMELPGATSEDCLTLNVWAPAAPGPHPVVFSIYGGGNFLGSSAQENYDGRRFAEQGLVFVSANYRLGAFGFVEFGAIDPAYAGSGTVGLRDIEAALRWVRDNIGGFGGDPARVTLIGVSAGGKNQCALAAAPSARGLFRRMTVFSGGGGTIFRSPEEARPVAEALLRAASVRTVAELAALPVDALLAAQMKLLASFPKGFPFRPTVDGRWLPETPVEAARAGRTAGIDLVLGTCADEAVLGLPPAKADAPFAAAQLASLDLDRMNALVPRYDALLADLPPGDRRIRQLTAEEYWVQAVRFAEAHAGAGGRTWMYRFDWKVAAGPLAGYAPHGSDSGFVYGGKGMGLPMPPGAAEAAGRTQVMWAGWARGGEPVLPGGPAWPRYDPARRKTLILGQTPHVEADPRGAERRLWDGLL